MTAATTIERPTTQDAEAHEIECSCCGQLVDEDETERYRYMCGGEWCDGAVCSDCIRLGRVERCDECEAWHDSGDMLGVYVARNGRYHSTPETWCPECLEQARDQGRVSDCDHCGETHVDAVQSYELWDGSWIDLCPECRDDELWTCERCGRYVLSDDIREYRDEYYCPECYEEESERSALRAYGRTAPDRCEYLRSADEDGCDVGPLFVGIELETVGKYSAADVAESVVESCAGVTGIRTLGGSVPIDYLECKEDCSLGDEGCEIAFYPMTPRAALCSGLLATVANAALFAHATSHDAGCCGLHVHISRKALPTSAHVYALERLIQRHEREWVRFSRRTPDAVSRWAEISWAGCEEIDAAERAEKLDTYVSKKKAYYRYTAVNDSNMNTVELRLWRGTLRVATLMATVQASVGLALVARRLVRLGDVERVEDMTWPEVKDAICAELEGAGLPSGEFRGYCAEREI